MTPMRWCNLWRKLCHDAGQSPGVRKSGHENAIYKVGETNLEFTEPLDAHSAMGQYLAREGPGVYHIAFGVDGIAEVAKGLAAQGNTLREPGGTGRSAEGYLTATLDRQAFGISLPSGGRVVPRACGGGDWRQVHEEVGRRPAGHDAGGA